VGIAEAVTAAATEHAITRKQFGRPIGVNQAIKHTCANMAVATEAARSQLFYAAASVEAQRADAAEQVSIARVIASDAAIANAQSNIQVHGGMGYTAEHDAHLFVKRARALAPLLGGRRAHLNAILETERSA
jgi:alkylation response protein AidB-like acyl-CoA dehydrogenase